MKQFSTDSKRDLFVFDFVDPVRGDQLNLFEQQAVRYQNKADRVGVRVCHYAHDTPHMMFIAAVNGCTFAQSHRSMWNVALDGFLTDERVICKACNDHAFGWIPVQRRSIGISLDMLGLLDR